MGTRPIRASAARLKPVSALRGGRRQTGALVHHDIPDAERDSHMRGGAPLRRLATLGIAELQDLAAGRVVLLQLGLGDLGEPGRSWASVALAMFAAVAGSHFSVTVLVPSAPSLGLITISPVLSTGSKVWELT